MSDDDTLADLRAACERVEALADSASAWDPATLTGVQIGNKIRAALNGTGTRLYWAVRDEASRG
jgi:hypothetical protein